MIKSLFILLILWGLAALEVNIKPEQCIFAAVASVWTLLFLVLNRKVLTSLI